MIRSTWRLAALIVRRTFSLNRTSSLAASISFFAILSFMPFMLLTTSILSSVLASSNTALDDLVNFIGQNFPMTAATTLDVFKDAARHGTIYGIIGLIGLFWAGSKVFDITEYTMNRIWRCRSNRSYWQSKMIAFISIPTMMIFVLVSILLTTLLQLLEHGQIPFLEIAAMDIPVIGTILSFLAPVLISTLLFVLIYYLLPNRWDHFRSAFFGALVAAFLWEIAKLLFDYYVRHFGQIFTVYGSFASLALLFLWVYYSAFVVLLGAELGSLLQTIREHHELPAELK